MQNNRVHNKQDLKQFRKSLRNNSTSAETVLWTYLKQKQLDGRKFTRQHSIGKYIVDFYCSSEKLIVELDGDHHFWEEGIQHDLKRTDYLNSLKLKVIRFENKWVFEDIDYVIEEIKKHFKNQSNF